MARVTRVRRGLLYGPLHLITRWQFMLTLHPLARLPVEHVLLSPTHHRAS